MAGTRARPWVDKFSHVFLPWIILLTAWCRTLKEQKSALPVLGTHKRVPCQCSGQAKVLR